MKNTSRHWDLYRANLKICTIQIFKWIFVSAVIRAPHLTSTLVTLSGWRGETVHTCRLAASPWWCPGPPRGESGQTAWRGPWCWSCTSGPGPPERSATGLEERASLWDLHIHALPFVMTLLYSCSTIRYDTSLFVPYRSLWHFYIRALPFFLTLPYSCLNIRFDTSILVP